MSLAPADDRYTFRAIPCDSFAVVFLIELSPFMSTASSPLASRAFEIASIDYLVLAGWAGRDTAAVEAHIRELEVLGTPRPSRTPIFYRVSASLLTTADAIQVVGGDSSGEVEFIIVRDADGLWVGLGSDHTDRALERSNVALSKQLCAKIAAPTLWRFDDVASHWDRLELRSWAHRDGQRELYQDGLVSAVLQPARLLELHEQSATGLPTGGALFGGTIPTVNAIGPADKFEMELHDPVVGRSLRHRYEIQTLPVNA
ncbi:MAG TPA: DUF2848 domain-containing protein [Gemmatimonadaceae bacterium]|nr:DUF2848 domain-containing protein [Gemmatimonadaceae bacterium]